MNNITSLDNITTTTTPKASKSVVAEPPCRTSSFLDLDDPGNDNSENTYSSCSASTTISTSSMTTTTSSPSTASISSSSESSKTAPSFNFNSPSSVTAVPFLSPNFSMSTSATTASLSSSSSSTRSPHNSNQASRRSSSIPYWPTSSTYSVNASQITNSSESSVLHESDWFRKVGGRPFHPYPYTQVPYWYSYDKPVEEFFYLVSAFQRMLTSEYPSDKEPPSNVLDIGCGKSAMWILEQAQEIGWENTHFTGIDIVPVFLPIDQFPESLSSRLTFKQENIFEGLPFDDNTFDFVRVSQISAGVPEHRWNDICDEVSRVLKPGGHTFFSDMNPPQILPVPDKIPAKTLEDTLPSKLKSSASSSNSAETSSIHIPPPQVIKTLPVKFFSDTSSLYSHDKENTPRGSAELTKAWVDILEKRYLSTFPLAAIPSAMTLCFEQLESSGPKKFYFPSRAPLRPTSEEQDGTSTNSDKEYQDLLLTSRRTSSASNTRASQSLHHSFTAPTKRIQEKPYTTEKEQLDLDQLETAVRIVFHAAINMHSCLVPALLDLPAPEPKDSDGNKKPAKNVLLAPFDQLNLKSPPQTPPSTTKKEKIGSLRYGKTYGGIPVGKKGVYGQYRKAIEASREDLISRAGVSALIMSRMDWVPEMDKKAVVQHERNFNALQEELQKSISESASASASASPSATSSYPSTSGNRTTQTPARSNTISHYRNSSWQISGFSNSSSNSSNNRISELAKLKRTAEADLKAAKKRIDPYYNVHTQENPDDLPDAVGYIEIGYNHGVAP